MELTDSIPKILKKKSINNVKFLGNRQEATRKSGKKLKWMFLNLK